MNSIEEDIDKIINDLEMALVTDLYGHITTLVKKEDLEHLIKAYKELEEENRIFALEGSRVRLKIHIDKNYIPVSLVEEKIEELKEEIEQLRIEKNVTYDSGIYRNRIKLETLQELLEKR